MAKVLVVGGAGYVGSAACAWLIDKGHDVWILDDLSTGHRELVLSPHFICARAGDTDIVRPLLKEQKFDCVMHFAGRSLVGESFAKRDEYFENNVEQTRLLLDAMAAEGTKRIIFSSSCAIFGDPGNIPIEENTRKKPINPYGETKLEVEKLLVRRASSERLQAITLRYFNAAGAEPKIRVGEWHTPETHLIPNILKAAARGEPVQILGTNYPTPDGTCIRDYIHVTDLAAAHEAAMLRLLAKPEKTGHFEAFNLGSAQGFSVQQIISACERMLGKKVKTKVKPRRYGDPPRLVAQSTLASKELGLSIGGDSLQRIISTAWDWEKMQQKPKKAVFLDRDGTLNDDPGYLSRPEQMNLFPGVGEALLALKKAGYLLVVVSNQSGVARGLIEPSAIPKINERLDELLRPWGVRIDHYELCFHHPDDDCECRKPKPKLISCAAEKLGIDVSQSYMIGDKESDLGAGRAAGCKGVGLVRTGNGRKTEAKIKSESSNFIGDSLVEIAHWILNPENANS